VETGQLCLRERMFTAAPSARRSAGCHDLEDHAAGVPQDILPVDIAPFIAARRTPQAIRAPVVYATPAIPVLMAHVLASSPVLVPNIMITMTVVVITITIPMLLVIVMFLGDYGRARKGES
jgi:hypothetical protein